MANNKYNNETRLAIEELKNDIRVYKGLLKESDYKAIKYAEGIINEEDYKEIKTAREGFRGKINELEQEIEKKMKN